MKNNKQELDQFIRASMELTDKPSLELNNLLKAEIYKQEAQKKKKAPTISLWYVPMLLNLVTFTLIAFAALLTIPNPYLAKITACACGYITVAGFILTWLGMKRADMKKEVSINIKKRGALT